MRACLKTRNWRHGCRPNPRARMPALRRSAGIRACGFTELPSSVSPTGLSIPALKHEFVWRQLSAEGPRWLGQKNGCCSFYPPSFCLPGLAPEALTPAGELALDRLTADEVKVLSHAAPAPRREIRAMNANATSNASVPAKIKTRTPPEAARTALAFSPIRKSASRSTATARWKVSTRPCSGMLARIAAALDTAASCCWINFSARRIVAVLSSAVLRSMISLASCCV